MQGGVPLDFWLAFHQALDGNGSSARVGDPNTRKHRCNMNLIVENDTMKVEGLTRISAENYREVIDSVRARLPQKAKAIEVYLSNVSFIDSQGLSALIALKKTIGAHGGRIVLVEPTRVVEQILEITQLNRIFEIKK
jgi:anti-anti-sigma factor